MSARPWIYFLKAGVMDQAAARIRDPLCLPPVEPMAMPHLAQNCFEIVDT